MLEKGLANLIKISKERDMDALHKYLLDMRESNGKVSVHHQCRRKFTDTRKRKSNTFHSKRLQSSSDAPKFDWKESCFLCSEKINKVLKNRDPFFKVGTLQIRANLITRAKERNDDWSNQVMGRLLTCNDLVAEEAVYHNSCMNRFRLEKMNSGKKGRPVNISMMVAYEKVCNWLENETDCELYTLKEVHEKMSSLCDGDEVYTIKTLKNKLQETYKDHIYFSQLPGRENVICFRNMADRIIFEMKKKPQQTKSDIILAAAKLIKADIQAIEKNTDYCPSVDDIKNEDNLKWVPQSLQTFLGTLISSSLKKKTLGHCITQAARPRSLMCPLVFGLRVELEKTFGSKWLINHLSRLGLCISYDEVQRFKMLSIESTERATDKNKPEFMQWVADNVTLGAELG